MAQGTWHDRFVKLRGMVALLSGHYELDWASYSEREANLMRTGLLDDFKITIELAWKTLKDYLRDEHSVLVKSPREVVQEAWALDLIPSAESWVEMLTRRNELAHTYSKEGALKAFDEIRDECLPLLQAVVSVLESRVGNG